MQVTDLEYCQNCKCTQKCSIHCDPDVTTWRCLTCGKVVDQMFTDDEVEWEDDDDEE